MGKKRGWRDGDGVLEIVTMKLKGGSKNCPFVQLLCYFEAENALPLNKISNF